jgi:hypothetical protein
MLSEAGMTRFALRYLLVLGMLAAVRPAIAVTPENFQIKTGADLVTLCATPTDDPLYTAAVHFCHGFCAGTYQTLQAITSHRKATPLFCPSNPPPSRNDAVQRFTAWAQKNPQYHGDAPADLIGRFLVTEFPCPK